MSYFTLEATKYFLKNIDDLVIYPSAGITQADLDRAEEAAASTIDAYLTPVYGAAVVLVWQTTTPPFLAMVAELLSSAIVIQYKYERMGVEDDDETSTPDKLWNRGMDFLVKLATGILPLIDDSGEIIVPEYGTLSRLPSMIGPTAEFFPWENDTKSYSIPSRFTFEQVFKDINI